VNSYALGGVEGLFSLYVCYVVVECCNSIIIGCLGLELYGFELVS